MGGYLLVTAARNEQHFLPGLVESIIKQTVKPLLWVIINDGSTDDTHRIITNLEKEYPWVRELYLNNMGPKNYYHRYGYIMSKGCDYAIGLAKKNKINYNYLGIADADIIFQYNHFEKMIKKFDKDPMLGLASGILSGLGERNNLKNDERNPDGSHLFFRKKCFESIGGFSSLPSPDSISIFKVRNRGWYIRSFHDLKVVHRRPAGSLINYVGRGEEMYFIGYHPINAFLTVIYFFIHKSPKAGFDYFIGYFKKLIQREKRTSDMEVRRYYWNSLRRIVRRCLFFNTDCV
ncbi:MAG: glycosyltransferase [Candidatus Odinarchaeia archaeon]